MMVAEASPRKAAEGSTGTSQALPPGRSPAATPEPASAVPAEPGPVATPEGFGAATPGGGRELHASFGPRIVLLVLGVLGIQLGFIGSYVGAFHHPVPHSAPVAVVAPGPSARSMSAGLDRLPGRPVSSRVVAARADAVRLIDNESVDGALVVTRRGLQVLVAGGDGGAMSDAVATVGQAFAASEHMQATVTDVRPESSGDARGLSGFYLVVGWSVGGYLLASILAVSIGPRPRSRRDALVRLGALAAYSVLSGVGGALVVRSVGALPLHTIALAALGTLTVFGVGAFSMGLEAFAGVVGIGLVILVLVVLGNPSAGGAYPTPLLPAFWRAVGQWLPPGAGTTAVRTIEYFPAAGVLHQALVLGGYALAGMLATVAAAGWRKARLQAAPAGQ